jgi:hypothetical protein
MTHTEVSHQSDWVLIKVNWTIFHKLLPFPNSIFLTVDEMVKCFTVSLIKAAEKSNLSHPYILDESAWESKHYLMGFKESVFCLFW